MEPRQKNKISNFGTFSLYTQIFVYHSLSIWKRIKAKKRHLYSWTILLHIFDTLNIYMYITVVKNLCISFYHVVYVIIPCFPFSFYSPYIILLRTVLLIPKVSHGKPELPTVAILILLQLRPIGPYSSIIGRERSLVAWWVCDSVKFWTPLPAVASLALNYSLT